MVTYVQIGLLLDSLFHIYRFHKLGLSSITGIWGQPQSVTMSYCLSAWALLPVFCVKPVGLFLAKSIARFWWLALVALFLNQVAGRSVLKGIFDAMLLAVLLGWEVADEVYVRNSDHLKSEVQRTLMHSELMNLFQTTVVVATFIISTFGFSFAPTYIQTYYATSIGQPTVWWFGVMSAYVTCGVGVFIAARFWMLAMSKRRDNGAC